MRREATKKRAKQILDVLILLCGIGAIYCILKEIRTWRITPALLIAVTVMMVWVLFDLFRVGNGKAAESSLDEAEVIRSHGGHKIERLILLDEEGKPIRSWDLHGKVSQIIGKAGQDQELDIDLSDCEYSSFIDFQHAALNFCLDQWYIEDLGSQNGVKVRKVEDGECYKVIHRPCKVAAGDILYIANTKLLLT